MTRLTALRFAALLILLAPAPAPAQTAAAPTPAALPDGVRRIFALQSNNSLLVEGTEKDFASVAKLVKVLDTPPRQVVFQMELVAVPKARAGLYTPDMPASRLLPLLLRGESRVAAVSMEIVTDGRTAFFSADVPVIALPTTRFRLAQVGPRQDRHGLSALHTFRLTPRINADGTITLGLEFATVAPPSVRSFMPRTLRAGELVVYDVTGPPQRDSQRLFLFLQPTIIPIIGESGKSGAAKPNGGSSVIVTP